jgi:hypothetical protein
MGNPGVYAVKILRGLCRMDEPSKIGSHKEQVPGNLPKKTL